MAWKDACDILLREKYRIYHMIPFAHNYIHRFLLALDAERNVGKADGKLSSIEGLHIFLWTLPLLLFCFVWFVLLYSGWLFSLVIIILMVSFVKQSGLSGLVRRPSGTADGAQKFSFCQC